VARDRGGGREILFLSLIGFFGIFSTTMSKSPVLPLFVKSLSGSDALIGLVAAISPIAGILLSFPVGLLVDRRGKKRLLLAAAVVFVTAPLLYLLVRDPAWLIPLRLFHGIATATLGPVAAAFVVSAYPRQKGQMLGLYSSATLVGRTLAPLAGGAIISLLASYRAVYLGAFLLCVPLVVLVLLLPGEGGAGVAVKKVSFADFRSSFAAFAGNGRLLSTSLVEAATYFAYGCIETYLPVFLSRHGVPAWQIGVVFSLQIVSIALTKPLFGRMADRVDRRVQIMAGIVLMAAAVALLPLTASPVLTAVVAVFFGLALSVSTVATSTYVAEVAKEDNLGSSLGALNSVMDIGHSSGPFVAGMIITATSIAGGFLAAGVVCLASAALFSVMVFRRY
jgi:MFS family permease